MGINLDKWESTLRTDSALNERLTHLDAKGFPATKKGDLLCIKVKGKTPLVVSWDGSEIHVSKRDARKPFCSWTMGANKFNQLFLGTCPPLLVAMNNDQDNIKMGTDHHNGSLALSFMVMLQECMEGGEDK
ncbi:MAG: hypothetical protein KAQ81_13110 [Deltaproteobacteria bacterium]|nr:hypothetical protein [Deltaproteobacteria bacterium]